MCLLQKDMSQDLSTPLNETPVYSTLLKSRIDILITFHTL